jgi:uncharacterized protein YggU (UPF0235/DUF167 family)
VSVWRADPGGVLVRVKVQPRARRPGLAGTQPCADGPRLRIAVGKALAAALDVAPSAVTCVQGAAAREKLLRVAGASARLGARLEALA